MGIKKLHLLFGLSIFAILLFQNTILFGQDIYYVNRDEILYRFYSPIDGIIANLKEGEIIVDIGRQVSSDTNNIFRVEIKTESGETGWLAIDAISIKDSAELPDVISKRLWTNSYYLDVLRSQNRETLFIYEPFWINQFDKYKSIDSNIFGRDLYWYERAGTNSRYFTTIYSSIYELGYNYFDFINGRIDKKNNTYVFYSSCIRSLFNISEEDSLLNKYFPLNSNVKFSIEIDGDYLDVYVNDEKIMSLVELTENIKKQFDALLKNQAINLSYIYWPRRADGTMDYPPPVNMSGYQTTHNTIARLRLRDSSNTTSLIVTTLDSGVEVQVLETGVTVTIDGITAPWVKVLAENGFTGWCFSGYLEEIEQVVDSEITLENELSQTTKDSQFPIWLLIGGGLVLLAAVGVGVVALKRKK